MEYTEEEFKEYKESYIDEAYERLYDGDETLFGLLLDMIDPDKPKDQTRKARLIVAGLACEGLLNHLKKSNCIDDYRIEFEGCKETEEAVDQVLEEMWDKGCNFQDFFEPPYE